MGIRHFVLTSGLFGRVMSDFYLSSTVTIVSSRTWPLLLCSSPLSTTKVCPRFSRTQAFSRLCIRAYSGFFIYVISIVLYQSLYYFQKVCPDIFCTIRNVPHPVYFFIFIIYSVILPGLLNFYVKEFIYWQVGYLNDCLLLHGVRCIRFYFCLSHYTVWSLKVWTVFIIEPAPNTNDNTKKMSHKYLSNGV